jgi:hypothetical protein
VGAAHDDATVLALGHAYQTVTTHHLARPALTAPVGTAVA